MRLARTTTALLLTTGLTGVAPLAHAQTAAEPAKVSPSVQMHDAAMTDEGQRLKDSIDVLTELTGTPDNSIPQYLLDRAEAIVVIPSLIKGGFIVGAKHGKGVVSIRDRASNTWSAPGFVNMTGGSIGWQIGAESVDLVLLVMNKDGINQLLEDRFTLGGSLSLTAGPVGRSADAATNAQANAGILAYSRAKGLFAGATLEGAALHADTKANTAFYGEPCDLREVVMGGLDMMMLPPMARTWRTSVARIVGTGATAGGPMRGRPDLVVRQR
ncbi:MAG: lipid-binding SYLF domain-containing protein [Vicinamibacterales bacterium]